MKITKCKYCGKSPRMEFAGAGIKGGFKYALDICADCYFKHKKVTTPSTK
jgi:hypothetical protein